MRLLRHQINSDDRQYFIEKVNRPLVKAIKILGNRYPEPNIENLVHPNSKVFMAMRDEYLKHDTSNYRRAMFEIGFKILIAKYEHSPNWRNPIDFLVMLLFQSDWKPFNPSRQMNYWRN